MAAELGFGVAPDSVVRDVALALDDGLLGNAVHDERLAGAGAIVGDVALGPDDRRRVGPGGRGHGDRHARPETPDERRPTSGE